MFPVSCGAKCADCSWLCRIPSIRRIRIQTFSESDKYGLATIVIAQPIGTVIYGFLKWLLILLSNLEFIGIVLGVAVFFYAELEIHAAFGLKGEAKRTAQTVSGFFLVSVSMLLLSAIIDWISSQQQFPSLYNNFGIDVGEACVAAFGLLMLGTGIFGLHQTGRSGKGKLRVPEFTPFFVITIYAIFNALIFASSLNYYNQMDLIGKGFVWSIPTTLIPSVFLCITAWGKKQSQRVMGAMFLIIAPWIFLLIATLVLPHGRIILI